MITNVSYGNSETRGRLRQWKKKLARDYAVFERALDALSPNGRAAPVGIDMVKCTRPGRERAFKQINKLLGPGVTLEEVSLGKNNRTLAIWSILKPRDSVTIEVPDDFSESERASLAQDCVVVDYAVVGCIADVIQVTTGLWTIEVPDHALGRAVQRTRFLHPGALIREAHLNLLDLPVTVMGQAGFTGRRTSKTYIKAGLGCFVGSFHLIEDVSIGNRLSASVRTTTWLTEDQMHEDQIVLCEKGEKGQRLGKLMAQAAAADSLRAR